MTIIGLRVSVADASRPWAEERQADSSLAMVRFPGNGPTTCSNWGSQWFWWIAALVCVAGGVLTKWTAPVFFYGTAVPLLWWRGRLRLLFGRHHLASVLLGAAFCFSWVGAAIALTGWQPFYDTVSREALARLFPAHSGHGYPWREALLHPLRLLATTLPWSALALVALRPGFSQSWDARGRRLLQALHCWVWPNMLFWSLVPQHTVRHSFPLFPGIACLAGLVWIEWMRDRFKIRFKPWPVLISCMIAWLAVKIIFVQWVTPARNEHREPRVKGGQIAALVPDGKTLYLFRLKDEGIMFYYGRKVRRLPNPAQLPSSAEPLYCILDEVEWRDWHHDNTEILREMIDEQGDPMVLVRVR